MWVGWKAAGQTAVSRAETMGLGGLYLHTATPPREGSTLELVFDLPTGEVRARAIVRGSKQGKGMGIQFVQMRPEDRAKLNTYLARQEVLQKAAGVAPVPSSRPANPQSASAQPAKSQLAISPRREEAARRRFEKELRELIELTGKGSYYQLLGVTSESRDGEIKKSYYSLARRFHPDNHEGRRDLSTRLKDVMVIVTEAYRTLANEEKRAAYDKRLSASGGFSMHREKTRANECLRAKNFVGSVVWLRKCVEVMPEHALHHAMLARSLGTIPQYRNEAIEHFQKAIELDPWRELVYVQFAELYEAMRLPGRARSIYSKLLEINPTYNKASERIVALEAEEKARRVRR
jgi:curved DNA-binding protein CbpA